MLKLQFKLRPEVHSSLVADGLCSINGAPRCSGLYPRKYVWMSCQTKCCPQIAREVKRAPIYFSWQLALHS